MALPELVAVLLTVGYLALLFRRDLRCRFEVPERESPDDVWTFRVCALACVALVPAVLGGVAPWAAATPAALAAVIAFAVRDRGGLRWKLLPWRLVLLTEGLFLLVSALSRHGLSRLLADLAGHSTLRTTAVAAGASNAVNNLPAYLAIERAVPAGHPTQLLAALLGTNCGPLILIWGSLATLLWRERCKGYGVRIHPLRFALVGLGGVPVVLLGTWAALIVT